jgi:regulator of nucleoside diphosphate kinase
MSRISSRKPAIVLGETDHSRLEGLATTIEARNPAVAAAMFAELDRARVVPDRALPSGVVRMGATVTFRVDGAEPRTAALVYPGEADIEAARISVATPVGAALIGLSVGQSIAWVGTDGRARQLEVLAVEQHAPATAQGVTA